MHNNNLTPYMLSERHFMLTLCAAVVVHILGILIWQYTPKAKVMDIPIRTLNVRLGDAEVEDASLELQQQAAASAPAVQALDALLAAPKPVAAKPSDKSADGGKQFVREVNSPTIKKTKEGGSKGKQNAEIMSRYTQLISLWIQKFKVYPEEARVQGIRGEALVRIRIDRRGNIRYYQLERSTGHDILDAAAINMIRRANPVPAVPSDFVTGDLIELIIPVNFSLL